MLLFLPLTALNEKLQQRETCQIAEHLCYLPLILPAINVPLASDYINGISSFSSMIVMSLTSISFFLVFCRRILKTHLKKGRGGNFSQSRERGARQEYYWALEIDVMRGFWVAYAINPGKNERENYRLDMK